MSFKIIEGDITKLNVDAIVNAANTSLLGGSGVNGAIHQAAGPELLKECETLGGCHVGGAKITKGYDLKAKHVIHTVGPVWQGGSQNEEELLRFCYRNSLELASIHDLKSIAFPLISSGIYGYPKEQAMTVALWEIKEYLKSNDLEVHMVIFNDREAILSKDRKESLENFLDNHYQDDRILVHPDRLDQLIHAEMAMPSLAKTVEIYEKERKKIKRSLENVVAELQETFSEQLVRLIDLQERTDVDVYKKANVDRKLFSKIKNNRDYRPSKSTAVAFAISLELSLDEAKDLLLKAGFALSPSSRSDLIITYFIQEKIFDIFEINEALFAFHEPLLGV